MGRFDNMMRINAQRNNESLAAEIERLEEELNAAKFVNCERCVEKTANRCAEIAETHLDNLLPDKDVSAAIKRHGFIRVGIAADIRKEFNLPKAG